MRLMFAGFVKAKAEAKVKILRIEIFLLPLPSLSPFLPNYGSLIVLNI